MHTSVWSITNCRKHRITGSSIDWPDLKTFLRMISTLSVYSSESERLNLSRPTASTRSSTALANSYRPNCLCARCKPIRTSGRSAINTTDRPWTSPSEDWVISQKTINCRFVGPQSARLKEMRSVVSTTSDATNDPFTLTQLIIYSVLKSAYTRSGADWIIVLASILNETFHDPELKHHWYYKKYHLEYSQPLDFLVCLLENIPMYFVTIRLEVLVSVSLL